MSNSTSGDDPAMPSKVDAKVAPSGSVLSSQLSSSIIPISFEAPASQVPYIPVGGVMGLGSGYLFRTNSSLIGGKGQGATLSFWFSIDTLHASFSRTVALFAMEEQISSVVCALLQSDGRLEMCAS